MKREKLLMLRDSVWSAYNGNTLILTEQYVNGDFKKGTRYGEGQKIDYTIYSIQPEFPGGLHAMQKFIIGTLRYPKEDRKKGTQGKVFVEFIVNADGSISGAHVVKGVSPTIDEEAVRTVSLMPAWRPGTMRGKTVRVKFVVPLNFLLSR